MVDTIRKYSKAIYRFLLFAAAVMVIIYVFPRQGKFRYEYEHGKPWRHATLIAPVDFPIYKSQAELKTERENLLVNFKPYFSRDTVKEEEIIEKFKTDFIQVRSELFEKYPFLVASTVENKPFSLFREIRNQTEQLLHRIYRQGLISIPEEMSALPETSVIMVAKGNFAEPFEISEFLNYQSAYRLLSTEIYQFVDARTPVRQSEIDNFISEMELNRYLEANILYEAERTEQERQTVLRDMSLTSGIVIAGQRIIDTGEIIDERTAKILDSLKAEYENSLGRGNSRLYILLGQSMLVALLFLLIFLFLYFFRKDVYNKLLSITFLLLMVVSMVVLARLSRNDLFPIYIIPFAILPIMVRIFFDSRLAFFLHVVTILLAAFLSSNSFEFVIIQVPAGLMAMFSLFRMVRRSQLVRAAIFITATYALFYTALALWQEGGIDRIDYQRYGWFVINGALLLLIYPLIWVFEKLFGFLSDVTLVELADTNHPLLRRLSEKAPGTFQHSIQVGNLAQEAVYKIGGNPLLVRAGAMYHDIGKMGSALFFTENQAGTLNPHDKLPYEESAQIVIHHIESGIKMAQKEKIPEQIIDFIRTHQGTMKTKFFYNSFINENPNEVPDVSLFSYPGPTPFSKETAVLMMADSVEAASRSLKTYSDDEIDRLVENIIDNQIQEDQFINAPITFKEISEVKEVFKQKLKNMYHARIEYPELKKKVRH